MKARYIGKDRGIVKTNMIYDINIDEIKNTVSVTSMGHGCIISYPNKKMLYSNWELKNNK